MNKALAIFFVVFLAGSLFFAGCVQEKKWPVSPTPLTAVESPSPVASPSVAASVRASASPAASKSPSPAVSLAPSAAPSPSSTAASCVLAANPVSFTGPITGVVLAATFKNLPADVSEAKLKCFAADPGQTVSIGSQGGAFRSCAYPVAPLGGTTYEASASAGAVSCAVSLTNGYNAATPPSISIGSPSVTQANATVYWTTDATCGSDVVEYGLTTAYGTNATNSSAPATIAHSMFLSPLNANTTYHYRVRSCSVNNGVCSVSSDATLVTSAAPTPTPTPTPTPSWSFTALPATFGPLTLNASNNETTTVGITMNNTGNQALSGIACAANYTWITTSSCPSTLAVGSTAAVNFLVNSTGVSASTYSATLTFTITNATAQSSSGSVTVNS